MNGQSLIDKFPHAPKGEGIFLSQGMSRIVQQKEEKAIFLGGSVRRILILKVVAFNGSARKDGNTAILVRHVFAALEEEGIETEFVQLAGEAGSRVGPRAAGA